MGVAQGATIFSTEGRGGEWNLWRFSNWNKRLWKKEERSSSRQKIYLWVRIMVEICKSAWIVVLLLDIKQGCHFVKCAWFENMSMWKMAKGCKMSGFRLSWYKSGIFSVSIVGTPAILKPVGLWSKFLPGTQLDLLAPKLWSDDETSWWSFSFFQERWELSSTWYVHQKKREKTRILPFPDRERPNIFLLVSRVWKKRAKLLGHKYQPGESLLASRVSSLWVALV